MRLTDSINLTSTISETLLGIFLIKGKDSFHKADSEDKYIQAARNLSCTEKPSNFISREVVQHW